MQKEHSGGVNNAGLFRVPGEWSDDQRFAVKIEYFNYDDVDSVDDLVREELSTKGTVKHLLKKLVAAEVRKAQAETVVKILGIIIKAEDSGLAAVQLAFASGMMLSAAKSETEYAAEYGISKQHMQQGVEDFRELLGMRQTRVMRDETARDLMRLTNYRRSGA